MIEPGANLIGTGDLAKELKQDVSTICRWAQTNLAFRRCKQPGLRGQWSVAKLVDGGWIRDPAKVAHAAPLRFSYELQGVAQ